MIFSLFASVLCFFQGGDPAQERNYFLEVLFVNHVIPFLAFSWLYVMITQLLLIVNRDLSFFLSKRGPTSGYQSKKLEPVKCTRKSRRIFLYILKIKDFGKYVLQLLTIWIIQHMTWYGILRGHKTLYSVWSEIWTYIWITLRNIPKIQLVDECKDCDMYKRSAIDFSNCICWVWRKHQWEYLVSILFNSSIKVIVTLF